MRNNGATVGVSAVGWFFFFFLFVKVIAGRWPSHLQCVYLYLCSCVQYRKG